jgi:hypothetical protein
MSAQPAAIHMPMGARIFVAAATKENDYRCISGQAHRAGAARAQSVKRRFASQ